MADVPDLRHHGDADVAPGLADLAVNVRAGMPPPWLRERLVEAVDDVASYPDPRPAAEAIAARHGRPVVEVLPTAGGAEAFTLIAQALRPAVDATAPADITPLDGACPDAVHQPAHRPAKAHTATTAVRQAVVVHPQFTEPEVALMTAGHAVERVLLSAENGFVLDPTAVPYNADLVVVGNPTNPTSVLHPATTLEGLARPGRLLVVDEAFMDAVPGETESLAGRRDLPGLVVLRSLTKTWGLAGIRAGYVLAPAEVVERLRTIQPPWSVSSLAIAAMHACMQPHALAEAERMAAADEPVRQWFVAELQRLGAHVVTPARAPFVLARFPDGDLLRCRLRDAGWAVRRGDTFPGLSPDWIRIALRDHATLQRFLDQLSQLLST